ALEERVLERWRRHDVFAESLRRRDGAPEWVFYEGPPTANGRPGLHHVWARSFKDLFPRFHTMRGRYVTRKGGWDGHGLPVEVEVERELGLAGKTQIREFGIEEFNRRCRESVQRYVSEWEALTERMGMWLDTAGAYWTLTNGYIEPGRWLIRPTWPTSGSAGQGWSATSSSAGTGSRPSSERPGRPAGRSWPSSAPPTWPASTTSGPSTSSPPTETPTGSWWPTSSPPRTGRASS